MSQATENPWDDITRRWTELFEQQAELGKGWLEAQSEMAQAVASSSYSERPDVAAFAEMWTTATGGSGSSFNAMAAPFLGGTQVSEALRRVTQAPQLADAGGFERKMANLLHLFVEAQTASRAYEAALAQGWAEANQRFAAVMSQDPSAGAARPNAALRTWMECADEVFRARQRSGAFLESQRRVMRAGIDYLLAERELFEQFMEPTGLPTRTEIDELHKTVLNLKRQVRGLAQAAAQRDTSVATARPAAGTAAGRADRKEGS